jgi:hypothetical protein
LVFTIGWKEFELGTSKCKGFDENVFNVIFDRDANGSTCDCGYYLLPFWVVKRRKQKTKRYLFRRSESHTKHKSAKKYKAKKPLKQKKSTDQIRNANVLEVGLEDWNNRVLDLVNSSIADYRLESCLQKKKLVLFQEKRPPRLEKQAEFNAWCQCGRAKMKENEEARENCGLHCRTRKERFLDFVGFFFFNFFLRTQRGQWYKKQKGGWFLFSSFGFNFWIEDSLSSESIVKVFYQSFLCFFSFTLFISLGFFVLSLELFCLLH